VFVKMDFRVCGEI